ncbi:hypothetical protein [Streptomyces sp. CB03911]|uniref:hypothetical protein n=1 Tax=Streptomycetaceae TaxID=2062 RepID=UPI000AE86A2D|nr:hypothetical protein [Streptomyces sp. CB03911]
MKKQVVLDKIVDGLTGGLSEVDRDKIPGFTEVEVDPAKNHIRLHWKGDVPEATRNLIANLPTGVTAEVLPAKYSKAELHDAREKLLHDGKPQQLSSSITQTKTRITSIAPAIDGSGLDVAYDEDPSTSSPKAFDSPGRALLDEATRDKKTREVKIATDGLTGVETHVSYTRIAVDATRGEDYSPWWGGDGLRTPGDTICSSGFGVTRSDGTPLLTTAYHCGDGIYHNWYNGAFVGSTSVEDSYDTDDIRGINTGNAVGNMIYEGAWNDSAGTGKYVSGWGHNNVGDLVCQSAANSGTHCNAYITRTDYSFVGPNGVWRKVADYALADTPGEIAAANGDSGGPVYVYDSFGKAVARGTISALDNTVDCNGATTADGGTGGGTGTIRTPWCFSAMIYVPIYQTLFDKGWTINTG